MSEDIRPRFAGCLGRTVGRQGCRTQAYMDVFMACPGKIPREAWPSARLLNRGETPLPRDAAPTGRRSLDLYMPE